MSANIGNGNITFGDGTSTSTNVFLWSSVASHPTTLSQFTNDLGNYGGFLTAANALAGANLDNSNGVITNCGSRRGGVGHLTSGAWGLTWNGSTMNLKCYNCNCACNC